MYRGGTGITDIDRGLQRPACPGAGAISRPATRGDFSGLGNSEAVIDLGDAIGGARSGISKRHRNFLINVTAAHSRYRTDAGDVRIDGIKRSAGIHASAIDE